MPDIHLTVACGDYDRTRPLISGRIHTGGIDLTVIPISNAWARHQRMLRNDEFDACELSMSSFLMARDRLRALVGVPVFPYRMFRHSYLWCTRRSGIEAPIDLVGKRIGVGMYQITTAVWLRGHLEHDCGVAPADLEWVTEMPELVPFDVPKGVSIEVAPPGHSLEQMLLDGDLDAYIGVEGIPPHFAGDERVFRLFSRADEQEYFRRTGVFPIMHVLAVKAAVLEHDPWVGVGLLEAFRNAKAIANDYNRFPRVSSLAWALSYREEERALFGSDPYPYNLRDNRVALETVVQFAHEQGLIRQRPTVDELFAPSTIDFEEPMVGR